MATTVVAVYLAMRNLFDPTYDPLYMLAEGYVIPGLICLGMAGGVPAVMRHGKGWTAVTYVLLTSAVWLSMGSLICFMQMAG